MSLIPTSGCNFGESSINANTLFNSSTNFNISDPFSVTIGWQETTFVITANVQGFRSEDVKVEIRGRNVMLIIGNNNNNNNGGRQNTCNCIKSCQLPSNVNVEMTTTSINNGVLFVKVPTIVTEQKKLKNPPIVVANVHSRRRSFFC